MKTNEEFINDGSNASQCAKILKHMRTIGPITQLTAFKEYGCFRLASRIHDLRDRGENIIVEKVKTRTGKTVAQYRIAI